MEKIGCRSISSGKASGEALISPVPISFFGGVDPDTGIVVEKEHPRVADPFLYAKHVVIPDAIL